MVAEHRKQMVGCCPTHTSENRYVDESAERVVQTTR